MHNLNRIRRAGLPCPEVVCLKKHVLVMKFIGQDGKPAPTLKEALLSSAQVQKAYEDTVGIMSKMYVECNLIHADLSEFNLLWFRNQVCESSFLRPFAPSLTRSLASPRHQGSSMSVSLSCRLTPTPSPSSFETAST